MLHGVGRTSHRTSLKAVLLLWIFFICIYLCRVLCFGALWSPAGKGLTSLTLLYLTFCCVFITFPYDVLGQMWYLIVSIPDRCLLPYFDIFSYSSPSGILSWKGKPTKLVLLYFQLILKKQPYEIETAVFKYYRFSISERLIFSRFFKFIISKVSMILDFFVNMGKFSYLWITKLPVKKKWVIISKHVEFFS